MSCFTPKTKQQQQILSIYALCVKSTFCCLQVSGLPTPDLVWQLNGQIIRPDAAHKMLVRENGVHSLVIEPVTSRDAGIYTCIASNRAGQNSFNLELIVAGRGRQRVAAFEFT